MAHRDAVCNWIIVHVSSRFVKMNIQILFGGFPAANETLILIRYDWRLIYKYNFNGFGHSGAICVKWLRIKSQISFVR